MTFTLFYVANPAEKSGINFYNFGFLIELQNAIQIYHKIISCISYVGNFSKRFPRN